MADHAGTQTDPPAAMEVTGTVQQASWLARTTPPVEQLRTDLWSIPVPIPNNPLRYVSVYVLAGDTGLTVIDAGWGSDEAWSALSAGLAGIGASVTDVDAALITHHHFDHVGLAARLQRESGAWLGMHPADRDVLLEMTTRDDSVTLGEQVRYLEYLGAPSAEARSLWAGRLTDLASKLAVPDRLIHDQEILDLPGWRLRAVHTPGHTPGHLCFVDESSRGLFSGDHVLPRISPNITADRDPAVDALADYLASLEKVGGMDIDEVLPAHEWRFRGLAARTAALTAHHEHRLDELLGVIRRHPGSVPWDMAAELTWSRPWDQYDGFMRISAVNETMAHVVLLCSRGLIQRSSDPVPRYTAVK